MDSVYPELSLGAETTAPRIEPAETIELYYIAVVALPDHATDATAAGLRHLTVTVTPIVAAQLSCVPRQMTECSEGWHHGWHRGY